MAIVTVQQTSTMMVTARRITTLTINIAMDNGFDDNDGDDATGNDGDVDGNGATDNDIDDDDCNGAMNVRMSDCCLQGIKPCKCKGKGYQWVGNQVFRLRSRKELRKE